MWVYNPNTSEMENREVSFVPGLYKIFDEIIVNAADNKTNDSSMSEIRITMDRPSGEISVWNNGRGIPVEIHPKEKIYIPELIFGHLLTSSNYDDDQQKVTGGRNGYGAKLCNIFSVEFTLETADSTNKKKYKQTWTNNMGKMGKAKISDFNKGDDYTKVTFKPDFAKFGMEGIDDDFEAILVRRVYDLAGTCKVAVKFNGTRIPVRNFKQYMALYTKAIKKERGEEAINDKDEIIVDNPDPRWEVGFAVSDGSFQQVSFVNSIATTSGGTHVNYIADQICNKLADVLKKKNKNGASLKATQVRNHIFIFVNCLVVNPSFTSQTKEQLTTKSTQFGSKCVLSEDFLKKIQKTQVMNNILHFAQQKADQIMKKTDGHRRTRMNNPKLTDANKAGTKEGHHCTLILTEGDSAKGLAMAGRAVVGPDHFGVFPLRGKLLNIRDASVEQVSKNAEIQNIKNFLGLQHKKEYTDTRGLRYGHLMIMTDQDHDGSHIKGLLINFLQVAFPSLLKIPQFLVEFITPIVKVWRGDPKRPIELRSFFTMPEYEAWKKVHGHDKRWDKKYYKGLGTSSTDDAEVYFRDLDRHLKQFHTMQDHEAELIDLAFSKKKTDERKEWLRQFKPGTYLDHATDQITYTDFINKELILFSMADNIRSIPSVVDGLKPGQRKVLYTCFKRNVRKDIKVIELAGYVMGMTAYQHGEGSLHQTIIGLAQNFVGSNNVNCLEPSGNFGTRLQGGNDCASPRYIHTRLSPFARRIFHPTDDALLTYNIDDGSLIEPEVYVPVVPIVLINGAEGIGTGWSTSIPNFNPDDIVSNLKHLIKGEEMEPMKPWFRGFTGEVVDLGGDRHKFSGKVSMTGDNEVEITELPIRVWTQDFKDKLEEIIKAEKVPSFIKDYKDYNTNSRVHFIIQLDEKNAAKALGDGLEEKFKLSKTIATSNLVAFDAEGRITKYNSVHEIMREFYSVRIKFYEKRKQYLLSEMQRALDRLTNQARFVQMIIDGKLVISKKAKKALMQELRDLKFKPISTKQVTDVVEKEQDQNRNDESEDEETEIGADAFDYLLGMPLWSLTKERVEKLREQIGNKETEMDDLIKLSKEDIWLRDLDDFLAEWRYQLEDEHHRSKELSRRGRRVSSKLPTGTASRKKKTKAYADDDDSDFGVPKAKKTAAVSAAKSGKQGGLLDFLGKAPKKAPKSETLDEFDAFGDLDDDLEAEVLPTKSRAPAKESPADDDDDVAMPDALPAANKKATATKAAKKSPDSEEPGPAASRPGRARKPPVIADLDDSDSDNGDGMLGNVGSMVKGLSDGNKHGDDHDSMALFSEKSRPGSSLSAKPAAKPSRDPAPDADTTDYSRLVPEQSSHQSISVVSRERKAPMPEEDDDGEEAQDKEDEPESEDEPVVKPRRGRPAKSAVSKPAAKSTAKAEKPLAAKAKKPAAASAKPAAAAKKQSSLTSTTKASASAAKKGKGSKTAVDDGIGNDDDIDALANDLLDSPASGSAAAPDPAPAGKAGAGDESDVADPDGGSESEDMPISKPKARGRPAGKTATAGPAKKAAAPAPAKKAAAPSDSGSGRPARRAAATAKKPVYVDEDEDEESDDVLNSDGGDDYDDDDEDDF